MTSVSPNAKLTVSRVSQVLYLNATSDSRRISSAEQLTVALLSVDVLVVLYPSFSQYNRKVDSFNLQVIIIQIRINRQFTDVKLHYAWTVFAASFLIL